MAQAPRSRRRIHRTFGAQRRPLPLVSRGAATLSQSRARSSPSQRSTPSWAVTAACLATGGTMLIIASFFAQRAKMADLADSLGPIGVLVLAMAGAPLIIGIVRMLEKPEPRPDRCGLCRYYLPSSQSYQHGICGISLDRHPTSRHNSCDLFVASERAMARDRLSEAPHITDASRKA